MKRVGRSTFRKIYWGGLVGIFILFVLAAASTGMGGRRAGGRLEDPFAAALAWALAAWLLLGRRLAYKLVPLFVSRFWCPGCGDQIDAVDVWHCACGYHDHHERHILAGACPSCGKGAGHMNCPHCNCTILFW